MVEPALAAAAAGRSLLVGVSGIEGAGNQLLHFERDAPQRAADVLLVNDPRLSRAP